jgi:hypothetical protein
LGELLTLPTIVCTGLEQRERCGCGRAFAGLTSVRACTTAVVEEREEPLVLEELRNSRHYRSWTEQLNLAEAVEADFRALSEALPEPGRVVRIRNAPERFELFDARHRPPGASRSRTRR